MKRKLLCVAVALVMILPLAIAAIPFSFAAVQTDIAQPWTVSVASSTAGLNDADGTFVFDAPAWTGSSISSNLPLACYSDTALFATSITIPHSALVDDSGKDAGTCYQYISVMLSTAPITSTPAPGGVPGCAPLTSGNSLEFRMVSNLADEVLFYFYYNSGCISSGVALDDKVIAGINAGDTVGFEFVVNGANVDLYANGSVIFTYVGISSLFPGENGFYVAYTASAYGGNATGSVVVTDVNGMVPGDFTGFVIPWTAAGNAAINGAGEFVVSAPAWAGGAIYSNLAVPFTATTPINALIEIPHQALADDTGKDGTVCFQYFSFAIGNGLTSATPTNSANSCIVATEGDTWLEVRFVANLNDDVLVYFFKNGVCQNPVADLADLKIDDVVAGGAFWFEYAIDGDDVVVNVAGAPVFTFAGAAAAFATDNVAGVCFAASSYGGNTTPDVTVLAFNDTVPTWFADYTEFHVEPPFEPGEELVNPNNVDPANVNWSIATPWNADGLGPFGTVTYEANGNITLDATVGTWWPQATIVYNTKIEPSQTSVTFNKATFSDMSYLGYFGIFFYKKAPTTHSLVFMPNSYAPAIGNAANATGVFFGGDSRDAAHALGGMSNGAQVFFDNAYSDGVDTTISVGNVYVNPDDGRSYVKIAINGQTIQLGGADYEFDVTNTLDADGKTNLVLTAQGYGGSGGAVTVKRVNGINAGHADVRSELENRPVILGAQYRTTGAAGIRFGTQLPKGDELGALTISGTGHASFENIAAFGTLIMPLDKLNGNATYLRHTTTGTINGVEYLDLVCDKLYLNEQDYVTFTAVLIGIPAGMEDRDFVAVSYVEYADGTIVYSNPCIRNINQIAAASDLNYNA